jgi:hypothetical protein
VNDDTSPPHPDVPCLDAERAGEIVVMRLLKRRPGETGSDEPAAEDASTTTTEPAPASPATPGDGTPARSSRWRRTVTVPVTVPQRAVRRTVTVPSRAVDHVAVTPGLSLGSLAAIAAGAALAIAGAVALLRAGVDDTWYRPRVEVLDADHTALLGAIEIGAGILLLVAGLIRVRVIVAVLGLAMAISATAAAIDPAELQRELAIERWWAWTLVGVGVVLTLASLQVPRERHEAVVDLT